MSLRTLTPAEVWEFFDSQPGWAALTTIGSDGYPHTVAIGYFRLQEIIYCGCRDNTQKVRNVDRNPKISLLIENGRGEGRLLRGAMFQGEASVIRNPDQLLEIKQRLARARGQEAPTEIKGDVAYICLSPSKIISWSY